jgi:septal ring factor EnvC (AmiA/AmiB activator)
MNGSAVQAAQQFAMDWGGISLVITSLATLVASISAAILAVRNGGKLKQNDVAMTAQSVAIEEIKTQTNGLQDELKQAAHAEGRLEGHTAGAEGKP